jgi:hypothetical protein
MTPDSLNTRNYRRYGKASQYANWLFLAWRVINSVGEQLPLGRLCGQWTDTSPLA